MPFIQITIAEAHDAATKRALITGVSAAAAATGMPEEAFRVWIVEVSPNEVGADPAHPARDPWVVLADQRAIRRAGHPAQRRSARS
jgi:phenylpyruvate tautomerase PptA (4-oxalocrotonate tautomerase family)